VPQHVVRPVAPLIVDYFASHRLVIDYFAYAVHPGASARRTARHRLLRLAQAHRRLLCLRRATGDLWHDARLVVDYFTYATRPGASARHAARRIARR
jgi:hypothetical protein